MKSKETEFSDDLDDEKKKEIMEIRRKINLMKKKRKQKLRSKNVNTTEKKENIGGRKM